MCLSAASLSPALSLQLVPLQLVFKVPTTCASSFQLQENQTYLKIVTKCLGQLWSEGRVDCQLTPPVRMSKCPQARH